MDSVTDNMAPMTEQTSQTRGGGGRPRRRRPEEKRGTWKMRTMTLTSRTATHTIAVHIMYREKAAQPGKGRCGRSSRTGPLMPLTLLLLLLRLLPADVFLTLRRRRRRRRRCPHLLTDNMAVKAHTASIRSMCCYGLGKCVARQPVIPIKTPAVRT